MSELSEGETEADVVRQLRALAKAAEDQSEFVFAEADGPAVHVRYFSGSGSNVTFTAPFGFAPSGGAPAGSHYRDGGGPLRARRPLMITLREEEDADRAAKEEGIAREFQSGDARFDAKVYVDTSAPDAVLRELFASKALRDAALALIEEGVRSIELDDDRGNVSCTLFTFASRTHDARRGERLVRAFQQLVRSTPRVFDSGERRPADRQAQVIGAVAALSALLLIAGLPLYLWLAPNRCWVSSGDGANLNCALRGCCDPIAPGLALGVTLAFVSWFVAPRGIRGRSDSHRRRSIVAATSSLLAFELSMLGVAAYYWLIRSA